MKIKERIRNYIKGIVLEILHTDLTIDVKNFETQLFQTKRNVWNIIKTHPINRITFDLEYFDENNIEREVKTKFTSVKELYHGLDNLKAEDIAPDVHGIKGITLRVWYHYKDTIELEAHRYTQYSKRYSPSIVDEVAIKIRQHIKENLTEYLL